MNGSLQRKKPYKNYYIVINDYLKTGRQKWISTGTTNKKAAQIILTKTLAEIEDNSYSERCRKPFIDALMDYNLTTVKPDVQDTTMQGYLSILNNHIIPYFTPMRFMVSEVKPVIMQEYVNAKYKQGLATSTIRRHLSIFKSYFCFIAGLEIITSDPTEFVRLQKEKRDNNGDKVKSYTIYEIDELKKLIKVVNGDVIEPAVVIGGSYGLRRGEILGLRWRDIDFKNRTFRITNNITGPMKETEKSPKTEESKKVLPLTDNIIEYLLDLMQRQQKDKVEYGNAYKDEDKDYILRYPDGSRVSRGTLNRRFKDLLKRNNLKHIRLHDLRHSFATHLAKNTDTQTLKSLMRVGSVRTLEIYTHDTEDMTDRRNALDKFSLL